MLEHDKPKRLLKDTRRVRSRFLTITTYIVVALLIGTLVCLNEFVVSVQDPAELGKAPPRTPQELIDLQGREDALLNAEEALDTTGELYRIPIDRAMELIAEDSTGAE